MTFFGGCNVWHNIWHDSNCINFSYRRQKMKDKISGCLGCLGIIALVVFVIVGVAGLAIKLIF